MALTKVSENEISSNLHRKNAIINGDFDIWQRGVTFTNPSTSLEFSSDRWGGRRSGNQINSTVTQNSNAPTGAKLSLKFQRTPGDTTTDSFVLGQQIEGNTVIKLRSKSVVVSGKIYLGADFSGADVAIRFNTVSVEDQPSSLYSGFATDNTEQTASIINNSVKGSWVSFSTTYTIPSNGSALLVTFNWVPTGTAGADDSVSFSQIQLEAGTVATDFERRSIGEELALCQRYYIKNTDSMRMSALARTSFVGSAGQLYIFFPTTMRTIPVITEQAFFNGTATSPLQISIDGYLSTGTPNSAGSTMTNTGYTADAEL